MASALADLSETVSVDQLAEELADRSAVVSAGPSVAESEDRWVEVWADPLAAPVSVLHPVAALSLADSSVGLSEAS